MWGKNIRGCLGIGRLEDQYFPWRVRLGRAGARAACPQSTLAWCGSPAGTGSPGFQSLWRLQEAASEAGLGHTGASGLREGEG